MEDDDDPFGDRLRGRVWRFCMGLLGDREAAEEVTQDTLLTAWNRLDDFEGRSRFVTWVTGIARFKCMAHLRKRAELLVEDGVLDARRDDNLVSAYGFLRVEERQEVLMAAIAALSTVEQKALYMRYHQGMGIPQITEALGVEGASGARNVLQKSKRHLRQRLQQVMDERGLTASFMQLSEDGLPMEGWPQDDDDDDDEA